MSEDVHLRGDPGAGPGDWASGKKRPGTADGLPRRKGMPAGAAGQGLGHGRSRSSPAEGLLAAEEAKTWDFLQELTQDPAPLAPLLVPIDGNNLKAAVKCAATGTQPPRGIPSRGAVGAGSAAGHGARPGTSPPCPRPWRRRRSEACRAMLQTGDGQLCDVLVDRACLEEILRLGKGKRLSPCWSATASGPWPRRTSSMAARACKAGKNREFFELALAPCRCLDVAALAAGGPAGHGALAGLSGSHPLQPGSPARCRSPSPPLRSGGTTRPWSWFKGEKAEYESAGPLFAYAVARRRETDTVRIILSGKRNGLEDGRIRERLRETYV